MEAEEAALTSFPSREPPVADTRPGGFLGMTRQMFDSVTADRIPVTAQMVAGYGDGVYVWSAADWALFPNAVKVVISISAASNLGDVLDVEIGDASPAAAPAWVGRRRSEGADPTVYCSETNWVAVKHAFIAQGEIEPHYWIAGYPGSVGQALYLGSVAHQYADIGPYDLSIVADYWPGVDNNPLNADP